MIKKLLLILGLVVFSIMSYAQSAVQQADHAFVNGNYSDAVQLYEMIASTATNESERVKLYDKAKKCRDIITLYTQADKAYNRGDYANAKKLYQAILKQNSSDDLANKRLAECNNQITHASNSRQQKIDYTAALSDGATSTLMSYIKKYHGSSESELFSFIIDKANKSLNKSYIDKYIQAADLFADAGNKQKAIEWYDKAIALANPEAMYKKAMLYNNGDSQKDYKILLGMSHAAGYKPASDMVKDFNESSLSASKRLYDNLCKYETDLYAFVYVYVNQDLYPTQALDVEAYLLEHPYLSDPNLSYNDNLIYQYAMIVSEKSINHPTIEYMMLLAAYKGNIDATMWWLYNNSFKLTKDEAKERELYKIVYGDANKDKYHEDYKKGYEAVIKYFDGKELTRREWSSMVWIDEYFDPHIELMSRSYGRVYSKYSFRLFKSFVKSKTVWDKDVVDDIKKNVYRYCSSKYAKKVTKVISKVQTANNIYDKTNSLTYTMLKTDFFKKMHHYSSYVDRENATW